jgi:transcriptional regulator with XRE-family HTH domain
MGIRQAARSLAPVGRYLLMGRKARERPERLAEKLLQIRNSLGLSQSEMLRRLALEDAISYKKISEFELGNREPTLLMLLEYAHAANVIADVLIDDELDLPERLPSPARHEGIRRKSASRGARKSSASVKTRK